MGWAGEAGGNARTSRRPRWTVVWGRYQRCFGAATAVATLARSGVVVAAAAPAGPPKWAAPAAPVVQEQLPGPPWALRAAGRCCRYHRRPQTGCARMTSCWSPSGARAPRTDPRHRRRQTGCGRHRSAEKSPADASLAVQLWPRCRRHYPSTRPPVSCQSRQQTAVLRSQSLQRPRRAFVLRAWPWPAPRPAWLASKDRRVWRAEGASAAAGPRTRHGPSLTPALTRRRRPRHRRRTASERAAARRLLPWRPAAAAGPVAVRTPRSRRRRTACVSYSSTPWRREAAPHLGVDRDMWVLQR